MKKKKERNEKLEELFNKETYLLLQKKKKYSSNFRFNAD